MILLYRELMHTQYAAHVAHFSSNRQHLSFDVCLEVSEEIELIDTELFCVVLCTEVVHSPKHT